MATLWRKLVKSSSLNMWSDPRQPRALFTWAGGGRISWHTCWWGLCTPKQLYPEVVSLAHRRFPGSPQAALWDSNIAALKQEKLLQLQQNIRVCSQSGSANWDEMWAVAGQIKYGSCYKNKPVCKLSHETKLTMTLSNKKLLKLMTSTMKRPLTTNG